MEMVYIIETAIISGHLKTVGLFWKKYLKCAGTCKNVTTLLICITTNHWINIQTSVTASNECLREEARTYVVNKQPSLPLFPINSIGYFNKLYKILQSIGTCQCSSNYPIELSLGFHKRPTIFCLHISDQF